METKIVREKISKAEWGELQTIERIKLVADIEKEILALGCELHVDCADKLLEAGSSYQNLWGADIYPRTKTIDFVSLINLRPAQSNRSMEIQDPEIRTRVKAIIEKLLFQYS